MSIKCVECNKGHCKESQIGIPCGYIKKKSLIKAHGTLAEFRNASEKAFNDGFCTWEEKEKAIRDYKNELDSYNNPTESNQ
jgi:hypothetical protein